MEPEVRERFEKIEAILAETAERDRQAGLRMDRHDARMAEWFGAGFVRQGIFANAQRLDFDGLKGRLMSSSYAPKAGHLNHKPMLAALRDLFDRGANDGAVELLYDTRVYAGRPAV